MDETALQMHIDDMIQKLRTFDLEAEYVNGNIKRTGEFYSGPTFVVNNLWFNFRLIYRDLTDEPWRVGIHIVADDHTSNANICMCRFKEQLMEELESSEGVHMIRERIEKLAGEENGFYWP